MVSRLKLAGSVAALGFFASGAAFAQEAGPQAPPLGEEAADVIVVTGK
jgi:hypothetical protein